MAILRAVADQGPQPPQLRRKANSSLLNGIVSAGAFDFPLLQHPQ